MRGVSSPLPLQVLLSLEVLYVRAFQFVFVVLQGSLVHLEDSPSHLLL